MKEGKRGRKDEGRRGGKHEGSMEMVQDLYLNESQHMKN